MLTRQERNRCHPFLSSATLSGFCVFILWVCALSDGLLVGFFCQKVSSTMCAWCSCWWQCPKYVHLFNNRSAFALIRPFSLVMNLFHLMLRTGCYQFIWVLVLFTLSLFFPVVCLSLIFLFFFHPIIRRIYSYFHPNSDLPNPLSMQHHRCDHWRTSTSDLSACHLWRCTDAWQDGHGTLWKHGIVVHLK